MQRVDLIVDGVIKNTNQRSDNPAFLKRVDRFIQSAAHVEIKRTIVPAPKPPKPPKPVKPPLPINIDYLAPVRNCLILTGDVDPATNSALSSKWLFIFSADMIFRKFYMGSELIKFALETDRFRAWCDSRPSPDGTPPIVALEWLQQLGLHNTEKYFYGQCESPDQFDMAYRAGARKMVGKADALTEAQRNKLRNKEVLITNEAYYNVQPGLQPDWVNANEGIGGNCIAVYASRDEGANYYSLEQHIRDGKFVNGHDSIYVAGFLPNDWQTLYKL
jgi:hypothetical protein